MCVEEPHALPSLTCNQAGYAATRLAPKWHLTDSACAGCAHAIAGLRWAFAVPPSWPSAGQAGALV